LDIQAAESKRVIAELMCAFATFCAHFVQSLYASWPVSRGGFIHPERCALSIVRSSHEIQRKSLHSLNFFGWNELSGKRVRRRLTEPKPHMA
jgi:hypothetical protein